MDEMITPKEYCIENNIEFEELEDGVLSIDIANLTETQTKEIMELFDYNYTD